MSTQTPENYRKNPIWGTDFSKPTSVLIEEIGNEMVKLRGKIHDICYGYPHYTDHINCVSGLLTCGLTALHDAKKEISKCEVMMENQTRGKSIKFRSRGIGSEWLPGCFVCGVDSNKLMANIAAFINSKEDGEEIQKWFQECYEEHIETPPLNFNIINLDYRPHEPKYIQLKIGACQKHLHKLQWLHDKTTIHGVIRKADIRDAINYKKD